MAITNRGLKVSQGFNAPRIQTPPVGLMVEKSQAQVIGLVRGNPGLLGHIWILRDS